MIPHIEIPEDVEVPENDLNDFQQEISSVTKDLV